MKKRLPASVDVVARRREKVILDICNSTDFSPAKLREAIRRLGRFIDGHVAAH